MKNAKIFYILLLMFGLLLGLVSCAPGTRLNTLGGQGPELTGNYSVIYYGCNFYNDLETVAFLYREGSEYPFEPYAPDFNYRVKNSVPAKEAIETALKFVSCNSSFSRAQMRRIIAPEGKTLGYEVRPLYLPFSYGLEDVLYVDYWLKDAKVVIIVRLIPSIELMLHDGSGGRLMGK